ncbi:MAG: phage minor head protein [Dermatophilaceae bacterium]
MPTPDPAARAVASGWLQANLRLLTGPLAAAVEDLIADSYASGSLAAVQQIPGAGLISTLTGLYTDTKASWADWKPGNVSAADLTRGPGLSRLLDAAQLRIRGMSTTMLDRMGTILADGLAAGDPAEKIARQMRGIITSPSRALMIADTEMARAVSQASQDEYAQNQISHWDWLATPGACSICEDNEANSPYPTGQGPQIPAHPNCHCASSPVDPGLSG